MEIRIEVFRKMKDETEDNFTLTLEDPTVVAFDQVMAFAERLVSPLYTVQR